MSVTVFKIGGSLFDLPDFKFRLERCLNIYSNGPQLLVPGGAGVADTIRDYHHTHRLSENVSHWLAIRGMTLHSYFLQALLPRARVVADAESLADGEVGLLDAYSFLWADEGKPGALPHSWMVTSDSISLRVAKVVGASRLVLVKSTDRDAAPSWEEAARLGLVDAYFPQVVARTKMAIDWLNLRTLTVPVNG